MGKLSLLELLKLRHIFSYSKMVALMDHLGMKYDKQGLKEDYANSEVAQIFKPSLYAKKKLLKINAPAYSYQIDLIFLPKLKYDNKGYDKALIIVDILSRKAWVYPLKTAKMEEVIENLDTFRGVAKYIHGLSGDKGFDNTPMKDWCKEYDINLYTNVADDDHISGGDQLGIVDRFSRTIKGLITKYVLANDDPAWVEHIDKIVNLYNNMPHSGIGGQTPNEVYDSNELTGEQYLNGMKHNGKVQVNIPIGSNVRIVLKKGKYDKESNRWSTEIYKVVEQVSQKYILEDANGNKEKRKFKSFELQVINPKNLIEDIVKGDKVKDTVKKQKTVRQLRAEGIVDEEGALKAIKNVGSARPVRERKAPDRLNL
jgi:hypothetical protein